MFTLVESTIGAILIHFATTSYFAEAGRTVGFSSVLYNSFFKPSALSASILSGLLVSTVVTAAVIPEFIPPAASHGNILANACAGLLVGWGSSWGSGCTSGHMLCGLSLLRWRSFVATVVFSSAAMLMVKYAPIALPDCVEPCYKVSYALISKSKWRLLPLSIFAVILSQIRIRSRSFCGFKAGFVFGLGLFISGMANPLKPQRFLSIFNLDHFDPSLLMVVLFAIIPNVFKWGSILKSTSKPLFAPVFSLPQSQETPPKFLIGNVLFGLGWGLAGVCPGPGLLNSMLSIEGFVWLFAFLIASYIARRS